MTLIDFLSHRYGAIIPNISLHTGLHDVTRMLKDPAIAKYLGYAGKLSKYGGPATMVLTIGIGAGEIGMAWHNGPTEDACKTTSKVILSTTWGLAAAAVGFVVGAAIVVAIGGAPFLVMALIIGGTGLLFGYAGEEAGEWTGNNIYGPDTMWIGQWKTRQDETGDFYIAPWTDLR